MGKTLTVTNSKGILFNVRLVKKGDSYGRKMGLVHKKEDPLVEFYDTRYSDKDFGGYGQFVSSYYLSTILDVQGDLCLHTENEDWEVTKDNIEDIQREFTK